MTQEEKVLLLKDLSARMPYGVIVQQSPKYDDQHFAKHFADKWEIEPHDFNIIGIIGTNTLVTDKNIKERTYAKGIVSKPVTICIDNGLTKQIVRPYLRLMSSMTEEEVKEIQKINWQFCNFKNVEYYVGAADDGYCSVSQMSDILGYLNKHHFDYNGLIEKGLALEAPEGMYK